MENGKLDIGWHMHQRRAIQINLLSFSEQMVDFLVSKGNAVDLINLDFSKAFDAEPCGKLLFKWEKLDMNIMKKGKELVKWKKPTSVLNGKFTV